MLNYPNNRIYAIIPVYKVFGLIGCVEDVARKSLDGQLIIWDFDKDDKNIDTFKKHSDIRFFTYQEALIKMQEPEWSDFNFKNES